MKYFINNKIVKLLCLSVITAVTSCTTDENCVYEQEEDSGVNCVPFQDNTERANKL